jgi:hypothetical protein
VSGTPRPDRRPGTPRTAWLACAFTVLMAAGVLLQLARDARFPRDVVTEAVLYVPPGAAIGRLALSYDALLADIYWIRALQYFGRTRLSDDPDKRYDLLFPLLQITTTLDPLFNIAYRFGAIFLSEGHPDGPGRPDHAVALLEQGLAHRPGHWPYMQDIGFVHYWWDRDYVKAAAWFRRAAEQPDAPWWLGSLAASTEAMGGNLEASRALWRSLRDNADNEWLRENAAWRLQQLDAMEAVAELTRVVGRFEALSGRPPRSWRDLVGAGLLRGAPLDPAGVPFVLGPDGTVAVAPDSPLQPLPAPRAATGAAGSGPEASR